MSAEVTIYTTRVCGYCVAAKRLLTARNVPYKEIDVSTDPAKRAWLVETAALDRAGELAEKLK
jgi:glutaredoxin 3